MSNTGQQGGGVFATNGLTVTSSLFGANGAVAGGGGLFARGALVISSTLFLRNSAQMGGGVAHESGDGLIVNTLFAGNGATSGAALHLGGDGTATLKHVTIAGTEQAPGPGIATAKEIVLVENTIVSEHDVGLSVTDGFVTLNVNLFHGNGQDIEGNVAVEVAHLVGDPRYADPAGDDYHLQPGSAAINSGVDAAVTADIDGEQRPALGGFDIGYDEVQKQPAARVLLPVITRN